MPKRIAALQNIQKLACFTFIENAPRICGLIPKARMRYWGRFADPTTTLPWSGRSREDVPTNTSYVPSGDIQRCCDGSKMENERLSSVMATGFVSPGLS